MGQAHLPVSPSPRLQEGQFCVQATPWTSHRSSEGPPVAQTAARLPPLLLPALPIPAASQEHPSQALLQRHLPQDIQCSFSKRIRRALIPKQERGCGETGALVQCRWERKMVQLLWKTLCRLLRTKHGSTLGPAIPLSGTCPEEVRTGSGADACTCLSTAAQSGSIQVSTDRKWVNKMRPIHTRGYHPVFKRKEILAPAMTQMNLADIMLSDINQSRRVKHVCLHLCEVPRVVKPWRRKWQPTPVWPAEFHGQRDLAAFSPWGHRVGHD